MGSGASAADNCREHQWFSALQTFLGGEPALLGLRDLQVRPAVALACSGARSAFASAAASRPQNTKSARPVEARLVLPVIERAVIHAPTARIDAGLAHFFECVTSPLPRSPTRESPAVGEPGPSDAPPTTGSARFSSARAAARVPASARAQISDDPIRTPRACARRGHGSELHNGEARRTGARFFGFALGFGLASASVAGATRRTTAGRPDHHVALVATDRHVAASAGRPRGQRHRAEQRADRGDSGSASRGSSRSTGPHRGTGLVLDVIGDVESRARADQLDGDRFPLFDGQPRGRVFGIQRRRRDRRAGLRERTFMSGRIMRIFAVAGSALIIGASRGLPS